MSNDIGGDYRRTIRDYDKRLDELIAERDKLQAENADLREQLEASEATLEDEEAGAAETFDLWKLREAEASRLRSALESVHAIAMNLHRANDWTGMPLFALTDIERIRDVASKALDTGATT